MKDDLLILCNRWHPIPRDYEVELYTVDAGGHTWPGTSADLSALGTITQEINASQLMWEFFSAHPRQ